MTSRSLVLEVTPGAELPDRTLTWENSAGTVINFATDPHTFKLEIAFPTPVTKTTGITGGATTPNVTIAFAAGETDTWPRGGYSALLWARRTSDSKDREPIRLTVRVMRTIT